MENRLKAVHDAHELLAAMAYDGDGNRIFQLNYNLHTDDDWKNNSGNGNGSNKDNTGSGNSSAVSLSALGLDDTPLAGVLSGLGSEAVEEDSLLPAEEITAPELSLLTADGAEALAASPAEAKLNENGNNGNNGDGGNGNHYGWEAGESGSEDGGSGSTGDTSDSSDTTGNGNTNNTGGSQNQSGILMPQKPVSEIEQSLIDEIRETGHYKNYELIEYVNDVNRENTEVLMEANIDGAMDTAYTYGNERIALERFTGWTGYYTYDPRGSVSGVTDSEGKLWKSYRYSPTGDITFGKPQYNNSYSYNAEDYNPNLEVQYLRARYYDVERGNFLTEDPYLGKLTDPLSLNRYNYVKSSAPNYVDPSGYEAQSWVGIYDQTMNQSLNSYYNNFDQKDAGSQFMKKLTKSLNTYLSDLMNWAVDYGKAVACDPWSNIRDIGVGFAYSLLENIILRPGILFQSFLDSGINPDRWLQRYERDVIKNHVEYPESFYIGQIIGDAFQTVLAIQNLPWLLKNLVQIMTSIAGAMAAGSGGAAYGFSVAGGYGGSSSILIELGMEAEAAGAVAATVGSFGTAVIAGIVRSVGAGAIGDVNKLAQEITNNGSGGKGDSNTPDNVNYDSKQVGKKYGEHMKDYPDMKDYTEYKDYADEIFKSPDQIIHDAKNGEFYYTKGNDLLRIKENGDFVSLYPGAESGRVLDAISNGGVVWP